MYVCIFDYPNYIEHDGLAKRVGCLKTHTQNVPLSPNASDCASPMPFMASSGPQNRRAPDNWSPVAY